MTHNYVFEWTLKNCFALENVMDVLIDYLFTLFSSFCSVSSSTEMCTTEGGLANLDL